MPKVELESPASNAMLQWQYKMLIAELQQLQLHAGDPHCPCSLADLGEWCIPKHALSIASLAAETATMDNANTQLFYELQEAADEMHEKTKTALCGRGEAPDVVMWAREQRKKIEPLYYTCEVVSTGEVEEAPTLFQNWCYGGNGKGEKKICGGMVEMADALLAEIARQICTSGACFARGDKKAKLPICSPMEAKVLERCILDVKAKIKETGYKGSPFAICRASVGCRFGKGKKGTMPAGVH